MSQIKVDSIVPRGGLPGGATGGGIIQCVQTVKTDTWSAYSNGSETALAGLSVTITPQSASNKILLISSLFYSCYQTTYGFYYKRGSTIVGLGDAANNQQRVHGGLGHTYDANQCDQCTTYWIDSPGTTSATTYTLYMKNDNTRVMYINRSQNDQNNNTGKRGMSTVTAMEVSV